MLLTKLGEGSPIKYNLVRNTVSRSPINIVKNEEEYVVRFRLLVDKLHAANRVKASVSDSSNMNISIQCKGEFLKFNVLSDRLDMFLRFYFSNKTEYESVWSICILVFILSHGQINIERGFYINKGILVENLEAKSLIAGRLIHNHLKSEQIKSREFHIIPECRKNCKLTNDRCKLDLEKAKENKDLKMRNRKHKTKLEEIDKIKKQKLNVENTMSELQNEIKNETPVAEDYQNSTSLTKAASFHLNFFGGKNY